MIDDRIYETIEEVKEQLGESYIVEESVFNKSWFVVYFIFKGMHHRITIDKRYKLKNPQSDYCGISARDLVRLFKEQYEGYFKQGIRP